jgi:LmbE family N-acetylglucosaminyl deacetylase
MQLGRTESAIMTSAEQARFRINRPNSRPRATLVIALDARGAATLAGLKGRSWNGAKFLRYGGARRASQHLPSLRIDATVQDEAGNKLSLMKELAGVDAVIMLTATDAAEAAEIIGNACVARGIAATGLVLAPEEGAEALGQIVATLRPHTAMLVVSSSEDYAAEMLSALRA